MLQNIHPDKSQLMTVLWEIQRKKRFISHDDISKIAKAFNISRMEVEGVASFYHFFHRTDCGKFTIYLNNSIVSQHKGMREIKETFEKEIGIKTGQVTDDKLFGLYETACIGLSDQEPACLINFKPFTNLTPNKVRIIIEQLKKGAKPKDICDQPHSIIQYTPSLERTVFFKNYKPFSGLDFLKKIEPEALIKMIKKSKLSGRGGAFFPTGLKWEFARNNPGNRKYLICNADEGEPGTFKDRALLQEHPETLLEGMILAGYAIGASEGYIYLRAEYRYLKETLEKHIEIYRKYGFLGKRIHAKKPFNFDIHIHLGVGAYVCGEETALIHSMEGKRGEPGTKEHFPVEKGYKGKPTVVNNVETLCAVPRILQMGVDNWLALGTPKTPGTKIFSVSGDCEKPGIYEIEWGMKVADFLKLIGAKNPHYVLFNGYSGSCLSEMDFHREISGEGTLDPAIPLNIHNKLEYQQKMAGIGVKSGGAFMVFNSKRDILNIIQNVCNFFVKESCGVCVPCRTGNYLLNIKLDKIISGKAHQKDLEEIREWSKIIKTNSRCGLGIMSSNALISTMNKFPDIFEKQLVNGKENDTFFDLDAATSLYDEIITEITSDYE